MAKLGAGRMPYAGSEIVDERGLRLIHDWIRQLPVRTEEVVAIVRLKSLDEPTALARDHEQAGAEVERLAQELAKADNRDQATDHDRQRAADRAKQIGAERVEARAKGRAATIAQLLSSTSRSLLLARTLDENALPDAIREQVLAAAVTHPDVQVRDLFEKFLPDEKRAKRLGSVIRPPEILSLTGDTDRGKELFFNTAGVQCKSCHRIADTGSTLGPELTHIGTKYNRAQLLESILEPSKLIDPKYVTYLVETTQGLVHTGLLVEKTEDEVVLRDAQDKEIRIAARDVQQLVPQRQSIMPELLLRDMTAAQVADLLEYLESLK
jgi:putative heme-binding domain-containing protein